MLISIPEVLDILVTTVAAGFIFMGFVNEPGGETKSFAERLIFSILVAAPAIILHEFGHKFMALALGYTATFHAAYTWLAIGIVLKLISFPFLLIVPAYVSIIGASGFKAAMVAGAGPAVNGLLWLTSWLLLKFGKFSRRTEAILYYSRTINMFLFVFNLLPIPGFDGAGFWFNLFR